MSGILQVVVGVIDYNYVPVDVKIITDALGSAGFGACGNFLG